MPHALTSTDDAARLLTRHSALAYPMLREIGIDPAAVKRVSGIDRLGNLTARRTATSLVLGPPSSLLADSPTTPATLPTDLRDTLATDLRRLITTRQHLMFALVPAERLAALQVFFGADPSHAETHLLQPLSDSFLPSALKFVRAGSLSPELAERYLGGVDRPHVVVGMSPSAWLRAWAAGTPDQQEFVRMAFVGEESSTISSHNYRALREVGARVVPSSRLYRALHSPTFWAYLVVFIYSTLRALPATFVPHFHGSVLLLWTMDVVTAIPYTWGLVAFFTAHKTWVRVTGFAVTLITFIAPYIYFWSHGRGYSWWVHGVVGAMIAGALLYEGFNYLRDRAVAAGLRHSRL